MPPASSSFTTLLPGGGILRVLKNKCKVSQSFIPSGVGQEPPPVEFDAIWDTGATGSVITQRVVDACGLAPIGMTLVHGVNSVSQAEVYLVNIYLPNMVTFAQVQVTKGGLPPDTDMLIGMDIITMGDFAVTHKDGTTKFSFRVPSVTHIDFVEQHNAQLLRDQQSHGGMGNKRKKRNKDFGKNKK